MATNTSIPIMLTPLIASVALAFSAPAYGDDDMGKRASAPGQALAQNDQAAAKGGKPLRIKAPPLPKIRTVIKPGTWRHHRHKGNSPLFKPGREDGPGKPGGKGDDG